MHTFVATIAAFLMIPAKIVFQKNSSAQPLTPERLIRMGASN